MRLFNLSPFLLLVLTAVGLKAQSGLDPHLQAKFINPLPIPKAINARQGGSFNLSVTQFTQFLGIKDPVTGDSLKTKVWGYNGTYPGPTILAQENVPIDIYYYNNLVTDQNLPLPHLLLVDTTVDWAMSGVQNWQQYGVPIVTHLHGGHTESASDGLPDAWFTPGFSRTGSGFIGLGRANHYDNDQEAATLWYHDHALGITRLNVYAGLAGFYLLTNATEQGLKEANQLPADPYDLGIVIQDKMFTADGQLFYPAPAEEPGDPEPGVLPEFFGDYILVNGTTWPVLDVEPRAYRFRILNGSDSRFYNLYLSSGQSFTQVGTDDGLLPSPVALQQLLVGTGERRDVVIDFSGMQGQTVIMHNNAKTPYPKGRSVDPRTTGLIMAFRVNKPLNTSYPPTALPVSLRQAITPLQTNLASRKLILFETEDEFDRIKPMLGTVEQGVLNYHDPLTENPALNSTEIWEIYNETMDAHTIHLHAVKMQIINRQKYKADINDTTGKPERIRLLGNPFIPTADELGWKDTYILYPGEVTKIITKFDLPGRYVWHCHILSHEDHEMMRPYFTGPLPDGMMVKAKKSAIGETDALLQLSIQPNPFNSNVQVAFMLDKRSEVNINIYDAAGNLIKPVFHGTKEAGRQLFLIDGSNWAGGSYFLEINTDQVHITRQLVLQR